jgi:hypothetical protein
MDDGMDVTDAIRAALPSIVAMNAQKQLAPTGDPASDPNLQGAAGASNVAPAPGAPGADGPTPPPSPADIRQSGVQYPNS